MLRITTPVSTDQIDRMTVGKHVEIFGRILCGRDAVLPQLTRMIHSHDTFLEQIDLEGSVMFHTAVSPAGIGPTSSNKAEIEESIPDLAKAGVRIHLGKGSLSPSTVQALQSFQSVFVITPPVTALFSHRMTSHKVLAFAEEGMEALHEIEVEGLPGIVAAAHGENIFNK